MSISYELAEELKDAGFPLRYREDEPGDTVQGRKILVPTLSELIEACGDDYHDFIIRWRSGEWHAVAQIGELPDLDWQHGSTPEIAVAKLWLALNKK